MSKTLDKQSLVRSAWITELRRQGNRQCEGTMFDGGRVCALGLLSEVAGVANHRRQMDDAYYSEIAVAAGLKRWQADQVVARNDGSRVYGKKTQYRKHTFSEIADVVEGWFHA